MTAGPTISARGEPDAPPNPSHRRALELSAGLGMLLFVLLGLAGAWVGSCGLLACAAAVLAHAGGQAGGLAANSLSGEERRFSRLVLGLPLVALILAAVGEMFKRLVLGGAPDPGVLGVMAALTLATSLLARARLLRFSGDAGGWPGLWRLVRSEAIGACAIFAAAGLITLTDWRWPDVLAGAVISVLNRRPILTAVAAAWQVCVHRA